MKKLIKRKLFYQNGCSKNFFLWEVKNELGTNYELIEEFKGHRIARAMLRGIYPDRLHALDGFKKAVVAETNVQRAHVVQRFAFS